MNRRNSLRTLSLGAMASFASFGAATRWSFAQEKRVIEKLVKTDEEWKKILSPEAYKVLRKEGTERGRHQPAKRRKAQGCLSLCGLRSGLVQLGDEVRQRHRLAEFLHHAAGLVRNQSGLQN